MHELVLREADDLAVGVLSDGAPEIVLVVEDPAPDCVETASGDVGFVELRIALEHLFPDCAVCMVQRANFGGHVQVFLDGRMNVTAMEATIIASARYFCQDGGLPSRTIAELTATTGAISVDMAAMVAGRRASSTVQST